MTKVQRSASKIAWGIKTQSEFGTALDKADLDLDTKLPEPLLITTPDEPWTDQGMIGAGHEWPTQRGVKKQWIELELQEMDAPIDFVGMLIALFFGKIGSSGEGDNKTHLCHFDALGTLDAAKVTSLAILEDGNEKCVQDVACKSLTLRGEGSERLKVSASLLGTKLASDLATYTWPTAADLRYVWNYAGTFTFESDMKAQIRSFELTLDQAIDMDLAWIKVAAEADRIYASLWPLTESRGFSLRLSIRCESGDIATFRSAFQQKTEMALALSCLGLEIGDTDDFDEVAIAVPKAIITEPPVESFVGGYQHLDLTLGGNYNAATTGPISITVTNDVATYLTAAS